MADFEIAVSLTLQNEGGYTNNPADPGGATNMGIRQDDLPDIPIATLTVAQAKVYYLENYWKKGYSQIVIQSVANKLFDMGVLFGVGTTVRALQSALKVPVDGIFGPETLMAVNEPNTDLLWQLKTNLMQHMSVLVMGNPKLSAFRDGWAARINS